MILNGSEMIIGETIIMPIDISTLATTRSMIRNGMNSRKPIWNAVLSSEVTNAGSATRNGTASLSANGFSPARRANSCRSASRVWSSMKCLNGAAAAGSACSAASWPSM